MILFRILFWLLAFAIRVVLAVLILPFRILGGIARLGGPGIRVTRGPLNHGPIGASPHERAWEPAWR